MWPMWIPNVMAMAGCFRCSAHQQLARHLAPHDLDLLLRDALGDEAADEHGVAVGLRRVARLPEVRAQNEVLGADLLDVRGRLFVGDLAPVAHPREVGLRPHEGPRSEEHTSELQSRSDLVCRLLLEKKKTKPLND